METELVQKGDGPTDPEKKKLFTMHYNAGRAAAEGEITTLLDKKGTKIALEELSRKFSIPAEFIIFGRAFAAGENAKPEDFYDMGHKVVHYELLTAAALYSSTFLQSVANSTMIKNWAKILKENVK